MTLNIQVLLSVWQLTVEDLEAHAFCSCFCGFFGSILDLHGSGNLVNLGLDVVLVLVKS